MSSSIHTDYTFDECAVYVISISTHTVELNIPAWDWDDTIIVDVKDIPIMFFGVLLEKPRMTAFVNSDVLKKEDVIIKDYKLF